MFLNPLSSEKMANIKFNYLYRDGANYKSWGEVIFTNHEELHIKEVETKLMEAFLQEKLFIASQISIPEKFLYLHGEYTKDDHCYHEFDTVEVSEETATDTLGRNVVDFLRDVTLASKQGWIAFDILDRT